MLSVGLLVFSLADFSPFFGQLADELPETRNFKLKHRIMLLSSRTHSFGAQATRRRQVGGTKSGQEKNPEDVRIDSSGTGGIGFLAILFFWLR